MGKETTTQETANVDLTRIKVCGFEWIEKFYVQALLSTLNAVY